MSVLARLAGALVVVLYFSTMAVGGALHCSGDTDDCFPSELNTVIAVYAVVAGVWLLWVAAVAERARELALLFLLAGVAVPVLFGLVT